MLVLSACTGSKPRTEPAPIRADTGAPDVTSSRVYSSTFDAVAGAAGLVPLRFDTLNPGREVRVWIGVAIGAPKQLYRFVERGRRVDGEIIHYWSATRLPDDRPGETIHDLMVYSLTGRCDRFAVNEKVGICRARFARRPDWGEVLRRAEAAGLRELPDESTLPDRVLVFDGWSITVELREGDRYRAYRYGNPDAQPWPEARRAVEVARAVRSLDALEHGPDVQRIHRGVTTGAYRSEFRPCEGGGPWDFYASLRHWAYRVGIEVPGDSADTTALFYVEVEGELTPEWLARRWRSQYPRVLQVMRVMDVKPWTGAECGRNIDDFTEARPRHRVIEGEVWRHVGDSSAAPHALVRVMLHRPGEAHPLAAVQAGYDGRYRLDVSAADGEHHLSYSIIGFIPEVRRLMLSGEDSVTLAPVCMYVESIADVWIVSTDGTSGGQAYQFRDTVDAVITRARERITPVCRDEHLTRWVAPPPRD